MTDTIEKYLTLRGANNDIYFFQKRVNEKVAEVIGTSFVKTSLKTKVLGPHKDGCLALVAFVVRVPRVPDLKIFFYQFAQW